MWAMREDITPFERREIDGRTTLWLHGTEDNRVVVDEDKIHIILWAMINGWDIDILDAIINATINIGCIADKFEKDDKDRLIINSNIHIGHSEIRHADFSSATFNGNVDFSSATFSSAIFKSTTFSGGADFWSTTFSYTDFSSATFNGNVNFSSANFNHADFNSATFNGNANFRLATFNVVAIFSDATFSPIAEFNYSHFREYGDLAEANLDKVSPDSLDSIGDAYVRSSIREAHYFFQRAGEGYWSKADYLKASDSFRNAKVEYDKEGKRRESSAMYVKEMKCIKESSGWCKKYLLYWPWELICKYGESWVRFALWVFGIIVVFALIYTPSPWGIIEFGNRPYSLDNNFWDSLPTALYLSISTFASFGNLEPVNNLGKFCVSSELLLGYLMFGVLITLVARKMTRS